MTHNARRPAARDSSPNTNGKRVSVRPPDSARTTGINLGLPNAGNAARAIRAAAQTFGVYK